jgi:hypothetical protein
MNEADGTPTHSSLSRVGECPQVNGSTPSWVVAAYRKVLSESKVVLELTSALTSILDEYEDLVKRALAMNDQSRLQLGSAVLHKRI